MKSNGQSDFLKKSKPPRLSTPTRIGLTPTFVDQEVIILTATPTKFNFEGDEVEGYHLSIRTEEGKVIENVGLSASVLVGNLREYLAGGGKLPISVKPIREEGNRYYTFE